MTARVTPDDGAVAFIDARDIADVAADVVTREGPFRENLLGLGLPAAQVEDNLDLFTVYRAGYPATVTPKVADNLGRAPRSLATSVHDHRAVVTTDA